MIKGKESESDYKLKILNIKINLFFWNTRDLRDRVSYWSGEQRKEVSDKSFLVNLINYSKDIHISQFLSIGVGG